MNLLNKTIQSINQLEETACCQVQELLQTKLPNYKQLGLMADILYKYAGITGKTSFTLPKKCSIIACADHGVAVMKISAYPPETTVQMTRNYLIAKGAVANALSNFTQANLQIVDMGIGADVSDIPNLIHKKIAFGTKNCATGAAMTRSQAIQAIETGIDLVKKLIAQGYTCFLPGEMGIANTTSSAAIVAALCKLTPEQATGRGTNISDERLLVKIAIVRQALAINKPNPNDAIDVLAKVGGFELGCITGIILGAAANKACVILDGFNTSAAALIAAKLCPLSRNYLLASHLAAEQAHAQALETLQIKPYMNLAFRLGEATGSSIAAALLDGAITIFTALQADALPPHYQPSRLPQPRHFTKGNLADYIACLLPMNTAAQEKCQLYIDNLTKPIHSLGLLESLAVQLAGITGNNKPLITKKYLLTCTTSIAKLTFPAPLASLSANANALIYCLYLPENFKSSDYLTAIKSGIDYATNTLECNATTSFVILNQPSRAAATAISKALATDPTLSPDQLIAEYSTPELAATIGMMLAAAVKHNLIVVDNDTTQIAALLACKLAPKLKDYILVPEYADNISGILLSKNINKPAHFMLNLQLPGANTWCGGKLIDATMHMLHDMKTFEEAAVAVANDGPGASRQSTK